MSKNRKERIKTAIMKRPHVFYFIGIFLAYIALNLIINKFYETTNIFKTFVLWFIIPFLFFNFLLIPFLVAFTINLSVLRFKEAGFGSHTGATGFGIFGGILGGACPGCFVGLFPAFLGLFGVTASLSVLPLYGLELQILSAALLITAVIFLTRDIVCEVPLSEQKKIKRKL